MNQGSCVALLSLAVIQEQCEENNRKRKIDNSFAVAVQAISRRVSQSVEQKKTNKQTNSGCCSTNSFWICFIHGRLTKNR